MYVNTLFRLYGSLTNTIDRKKNKHVYLVHTSLCVMYKQGCRHTHTHTPCHSTHM